MAAKIRYRNCNGLFFEKLLYLRLFLYLCSRKRKKMMRRTVILFLTICLILMTGCGSNGISKHLEQIDTLLIKDDVDSAKSCLANIPMADMKTREDSAYFSLIQAEICYRLQDPLPPDNHIDRSIDFYKEKGDKERLARAYYYKAVTSYDSAQPQETILLMKKAEEQAERTDNLLLKHKICESLSYYNCVFYECKTSLHYAKKALDLAKELRDREREAIALIYMASCYQSLNQMDSLALCIRDCMPLVEYIAEKDKAYLYTRIGELYLDSEPELAEKYLLKAVSIYPQSYTYQALSNLYLRNGDVDNALGIWEKALSSKGSTKVRINILKAMRQQYLVSQNFSKANALADSIIYYQQKFYESEEQEHLLDIQARYDKETAERKIKDTMKTWGLGLLSVLMLIIGVLGYRSWLGFEARKELVVNKQQLEEQTKKAAEVESGRRRVESENNRLHQKIDELSQRHAGIVANGKRLYEGIEAGGTTVSWSKTDFTDCLEYYKMNDLPFINEMETEYRGLSPKYIFFAVLEHEGKSDEEIQRIMGITEGTLRSTRSRIHSKRR